MAVLHQFDYIFAIAAVFAALDAWNIGSPSLTPKLVPPLTK